MYQPERASQILVEAEFSGDLPTAEKWGISDRTIRNYRYRLESDPVFAKLFREKRALFCRSWIEKSAEVLVVGADQLKARMKVAQSEVDAKLLHAIAGVCKIMGELNIAANVVLDEDNADPVNRTNRALEGVEAIEAEIIEST